jgi:hypothetical protein
MNNTTLTTPIGANTANISAIERDTKLIHRIRQNMMHEADRMKIELARRKSRHQRLALFAPC